MEKFGISACFYPTTVLFVDDNRTFLNSLLLKLDERSIVPKLYSDPLAALRFLEEDYEPRSFIQRCILRPEKGQRNHHTLDIDLNAIHREIYNPLRFSEISVVVVDYAMPGLNGMDLSLLIREIDPRLQILMLTGEVDHDIAIQAFNEGSIDKFLRKDTAEFITQVNAEILDLQQRYFNDSSQIIIDSLGRNNQHLGDSWLGNQAFSKLFQQICADKKMVEYYLTDDYGSFLLLDAAGNPSWLAVRNETGMRQAYEKALTDIHFPGELLTPMKNHEKMLYCYEERFYSNPESAKKHLYPANQLVDPNATLYYAYITDPQAYDIHPQDVLTYKAYLDQIDEFCLPQPALSVKTNPR